MSHSAVNHPRRTLHGLYWKETRQLIPLLGMLLIMAVFLEIWWRVIGANHLIPSLGEYIPWVFPAVYAAGAGAILVGQEKETRTLRWLSSLPVPSPKIIGTKFSVALIGLLVMDAGCVLISGVIVMTVPGSRDHLLGARGSGWSGGAFWLIHSLFILCCGFYTAWRIKSTFVSLIALMPLAILPYLLTQGIGAVFEVDQMGSLRESVWRLALAYSIGTGIMFFLGYRAAVCSLSPVPAEKDVAIPDGWLTPWRSPRSVPITASPFRYSLSSLVWQSVHHNRLILLCLAAGTLAGVIAAGMLGTRVLVRWETVLVSMVVFAAVATSWLGIFAFSGDGRASRLRFLADRGVSPTRAWFGRHLIGITLLSLASLVYLLVSYVSLHFTNPPSGPNRLVFAMSMATILVCLVVVYSVSQWTSQVIPILAASAFVAPILSGVAVYWLVATAVFYGAPFGVLLFCSLIPMLATWLMMRCFMDDHLKWPIWVTGVVSVLLFAALPVLPFLWEVSTFPGISAERRSRLQAEATQIQPAQTRDSMMLASSSRPRLHPNDGTQITAEQVLAAMPVEPMLPDDLLAFSEADPNRQTPLWADRHIVLQSLREAEHSRFLFTQDPSDQQRIASLGKWIESHSDMVNRLRRSTRWTDQDIADVIEIWLLETLSQEEVRAFWGREFIEVAMVRIGDTKVRNRARRRAVLGSWHEWNQARLNEEELPIDFGGFFSSHHWFQWYRPAKRQRIEARLLDRLTDITLRMIDVAEAGGEAQPLRRELSGLMMPPVNGFGINPYLHESANRLYSKLSDSLWFYSHYPATQWYQGWEKEAHDLSLEYERQR